METHIKNILVTGANGQLGTEIRNLANFYASYIFTFTDYQELDITNPNACEDLIKKTKPNFIINCAAYTAVDKAEQEKTEANLLNATAPKILADLCKNLNVKLIHISTDYVFDGKTYLPYKETDDVNPESAYGKTKLLGELNVLDSGVGMVIRTSWLYSAYGNNFVKTILKHGAIKPELGVVFDQIGSPTWAHDLAKAILDIISKGEDHFTPEIFHYSNEGVCSWYDFAHEIISISNLQCQVKPIETKDYPTPAIRPKYSVFNKQKIRNLYNLEIPYWRDSLIECLKQLR